MGCSLMPRWRSFLFVDFFALATIVDVQKLIKLGNNEQ